MALWHRCTLALSNFELDNTHLNSLRASQDCLVRVQNRLAFVADLRNLEEGLEQFQARLNQHFAILIGGLVRSAIQQHGFCGTLHSMITY